MNLTAHLQHLEEQLLDPAVRKDPAQLDALLADGFREFGSSGRNYTKADMLDFLPTEPSTFTLALACFAVQLLAPTVALATYISTRTEQTTGATTHTQRSSLWVEQSGRWQIVFHQGTPAFPDIQLSD
jgi:hypothetical protein